MEQLVSLRYATGIAHLRGIGPCWRSWLSEAGWSICSGAGPSLSRVVIFRGIAAPPNDQDIARLTTSSFDFLIPNTRRYFQATALPPQRHPTKFYRDDCSRLRRDAFSNCTHRRLEPCRFCASTAIPGWSLPPHHPHSLPCASHGAVCVFRCQSTRLLLFCESLKKTDDRM